MGAVVAALGLVGILLCLVRWSWHFWAILGPQIEAGKGHFVRSGNPKAVFRSFSRVDHGTNGFLVRAVIA